MKLYTTWTKQSNVDHNKHKTPNKVDIIIFNVSYRKLMWFHVFYPRQKGWIFWLLWRNYPLIKPAISRMSHMKTDFIFYHLRNHFSFFITLWTCFPISLDVSSVVLSKNQSLVLLCLPRLHPQRVLASIHLGKDINTKKCYKIALYYEAFTVYKVKEHLIKHFLFMYYVTFIILRKLVRTQKTYPSACH